MKTNNNIKNRLNELIKLYKKNISDNDRRIRENYPNVIAEILEAESNQLRSVIDEIKECMQPKSEL